MQRDHFAHYALANIPKILTLLDRNRHSPTYGCFDRNFWHYKILDFPSGMSQEFVWPLALAYSCDIPGNSWRGREPIREWAAAAIHFAARSAHRDGSCDDYFPYERAAGATAFSLLACIESYILLGLDDAAILTFFERRSDWLARHQESGRLSNHAALIALCLELASRLLRTNRWDAAKSQRLSQVLSWQHPEGWFQEYEGCDPGYQTLTISSLARIDELAPGNARLKDALGRAVRFAAEFVHPDGSYGGEYGSRNTYNFFPHGFELVGRWMPEALQINDRYLTGMASGKLPCYEDDHLVGHHTWNFLLAWRDFVALRPALGPRPNGRILFPGAGMVIDRRDGTELYLALNKGGVFKLFRDGALVASDTQLSVQVRSGGRHPNAVAHLIDDYRIRERDEEVSIEGRLGWAKHVPMSPAKLILLRTIALTIGRFFPNLVRRYLQRVLIVGKVMAPFTFSRNLVWREGRWHVSDELRAPDWEAVESVTIGSDQTSIYVAMSRTFQMGQLSPWTELTDRVRGLAKGESLRVERQL